MLLNPGVRLRSQVCTAEIVVIRAETDVDLRCGGEPMIDLADPPAPGATVRDGFAGGTQLGKRYTDPDGSGALEVLVTKAGDGRLTLAETPLLVRSAKPLPSSD